MRNLKWTFTGFLLAALAVQAQQTGNQTSGAATPRAQQTADRSCCAPQASQGTRPRSTRWWTAGIEREHALIDLLKNRTHWLNLSPGPEARSKLGPVPVQEPYFLAASTQLRSGAPRVFLSNGSLQRQAPGGVTNLLKMSYKPTGFSWMSSSIVTTSTATTIPQLTPPRIPARRALHRVRRHPQEGSGQWPLPGPHLVEDQDYNIVRVNGTYIPRPATAYFFQHWIAGA